MKVEETTLTKTTKKLGSGATVHADTGVVGVGWGGKAWVRRDLRGDERKEEKKKVSASDDDNRDEYGRLEKKGGGGG